MRLVQDSAFPGAWDRRDGGDAIHPFYTLWFAVTGKMVGGHKVNRQNHYA